MHRLAKRMVGKVVFLLSFATTSTAVQAPLPWSFVNGAGKGYSIKLVSASPEPGTLLRVGQTVEFKVEVSYTLGIAQEGEVVLVVQDETNRSLLADGPQQHYTVKHGEGPVALQENFMVPEGAKEVRLFIPIRPKGVEITSGEVVLRYPIVTEANSSSIGYPSVEAALVDLHAQPAVQFREEHGWTTASDERRNTFWSFPPKGDAAYPAAVKRTIVQDDKGISIKMDVLCQASQSACDRLVQDFNALNERVRQSMQGKK